MRKPLILLALTFMLGVGAATADPPVCQVFCVTSPCSSNADCTAQPNGRCNFACPQTGCCVYG
jgi:hypothetical protein